jgi:hypothetical protein
MGSATREAYLVVIADIDDSAARQNAADYATTLVDPNRCSHHTLEDAIAFAVETASRQSQRSLMEALRLRYLSLWESDYLSNQVSQ